MRASVGFSEVFAGTGRPKLAKAKEGRMARLFTASLAFLVAILCGLAGQAAAAGLQYNTVYKDHQSRGPRRRRLEVHDRAPDHGPGRWPGPRQPDARP